MNEKYLEQAKLLIPDRRLLVNGAAKRAAELARGGRALIPINPQEERDFLDIALMEIAQGLLKVSLPGEPLA